MLNKEGDKKDTGPRTRPAPEKDKDFATCCCVEV